MIKSSRCRDSEILYYNNVIIITSRYSAALELQQVSYVGSADHRFLFIEEAGWQKKRET